ncbi:hypothetical protein Mapa_002950 [Marchantia paleacea]|nr:hypothetical protein Mapa_002950 [Marchantia paleacea]
MVASTIKGVGTVLLVATVVLTAYFGPSFAVTVPADVTALNALQSAWGSGGASLNWAGDPCDSGWTGVLCDPTKTKVISLSLDSRNLVGVMPPDIGGLANLEILELSVNPGLTGSLPKQIGDLTSLRTFVQWCTFNGQLPPEIGNLKNLEFLGINGNNFSGPLPDTLGNLDKVIWLDISQNMFSGPMPVSSTSASSLGLDSLLSVQHFHFNNNSLSGTIPPEIFSLPRLIHLILDHNSLQGQIPAEVENSANLTIIRLDYNNLEGPIPSGLNKVTTLTDLNFRSNKLTGVLPDLSNLTSLQSLDVNDNQMGPQTFPDWVLGYPSLTSLYLSNSGITGELNAKVLSLPSIETLDLRNNQINGSLTFNGAVSDTLTALILDNNNIDGFVGQPLQSGGKTFAISLYKNPLCDNQYIEPKGLLCLQYDPSNVYFPTAENCSASCNKNKILNPKMCSCGYPLEITLMLTAPSFSSFEDTSRLTNLETELAAKISDVKAYNVNLTPAQVYIYDAANTPDSRISLQIYFFAAVGDSLPDEERDGIIHSLRQHLFSISEGPFTLPLDSFSDNPGKTHLGPVAIAMIALGAFIATLIIIILFVYAQWQKRNAETADNPFRDWPGSDPEKKHGAAPRLKSARRFPLLELKAATNNWSEVLGEGGYGKVYKGTLKGGEVVAIKRANKDSVQGLSEFKNELELLSRVHHRNLVDLVGFCYEGGEQALVYEFMSNGTFRELLYERPGEPLSWQMRVDIILNSARGLAYLHDHASPPIIHGDIKTANVLLNHKLLAKVADFGLSKPTTEEENVLYSTEVRGTRGYLDPEYYQTYVHTSKSDVFSFGVVMIEALTAKSPTHGGKDNTREFRNSLEKGGWIALRPILDPYLESIPNKELEAYIGIALRCVEHSGEGRPTMTEVVKELEEFAGGGGSHPNSGVHRVDIPGSKSPEVYSDTVSLVKDTSTSNEKNEKDVDSSSFQYSGAYGVTTTITPK